jgi:hypothetical protein
MRFSERFGFKPVRLELQTDSMSAELRNSLWNVAHIFYLNEDGLQPYELYPSELKWLSQEAQIHFFKLPFDEIEQKSYQYIDRVKRWFFKSDFYSVYDFVEWLAQRTPRRIRSL